MTGTRTRPTRRFPTLACCGIDCGLCPRHHTTGSSRCPGCGGPGFFEKHPACGILSCCAVKKGVEVCSLCDEYPCARMESWSDGDSFVTHRRCGPNLVAVRERGLKPCLAAQRARIRLLKRMLRQYDDGRSKALLCLASAVLSVEALATSVEAASRRAREERLGARDVKPRAAILRSLLTERAAAEGVQLKLRGK